MQRRNVEHVASTQHCFSKRCCSKPGKCIFPPGRVQVDLAAVGGQPFLTWVHRAARRVKPHILAPDHLTQQVVMRVGVQRRHLRRRWSVSWRRPRLPPHRASRSNPCVDAVHGSHTAVIGCGNVCCKCRHLVQQCVLRQVVPGAGLTPTLRAQHGPQHLDQWQQTRAPAIGQIVRPNLHRHSARTSSPCPVGCVTPALQCRPVLHAACGWMTMR